MQCRLWANSAKRRPFVFGETCGNIGAMNENAEPKLLAGDDSPATEVTVASIVEALLFSKLVFLRFIEYQRVTANRELAMQVTVDGMVTDVSPAQPSKANSRILVTPDGMT